MRWVRLSWANNGAIGANKLAVGSAIAIVVATLTATAIDRKRFSWREANRWEVNRIPLMKTLQNNRQTAISQQDQTKLNGHPARPEMQQPFWRLTRTGALNPLSHTLLNLAVFCQLEDHKKTTT
jgi:hypothetical protein